MKMKYYLKERLIFDSFGNVVRGAFPWHNLKSKGKTKYYETAEDAQLDKLYLESLCNQYEYKIMCKEIAE